MDENAISVPCQIEGCDARINGDTRCSEHGGAPRYEWREDYYGRVTYGPAPALEGHHA